MSDMLLDSKLKEVIIKAARIEGVSDIHIIDGFVYVTKFKTIAPLKIANNHVEFDVDALETLIKDIAKIPATESVPYNAVRDLDTAYSLSYGENIIRLRANIASVFSLKNRNAVSVTLRVIPESIPEMSELGLPEAKIKALLENDKGIILVTGPTGSGKSTTVAAALERVNSTENKKIVTLEDPIENIFTNKKSVIVQREVGVHTDYKVGLHKALRQAPNIIFIGEMRDRETAEVALTAAETGHLVISTLHTRSSIETISRIIDLYPPERMTVVSAMLSQSLLGIISQDLIRTKDNKVRLAYEFFAPNVAQRNKIRGTIDKPIDIAGLKQTFDENRANESMISNLDKLVKEGLIDKETMNRYIVDESDKKK